MASEYMVITESVDRLYLKYRHGQDTPIYAIHYKLELSRAHTPRALSSCRFLHRDRPVMLTISTSPVVGMVDGRGYDGDKKTLFVTFVDRP